VIFAEDSVRLSPSSLCFTMTNICFSLPSTPSPFQDSFRDLGGQRLRRAPTNPEQPRLRESRTVAWCSVVENPASPQIANARTYCRGLEGSIVEPPSKTQSSLRTAPFALHFFHHATTAKSPSNPTSIHHPWPDRTSTTIWLRPFYIFVTVAPLTSHLTPYPSQQPTPPLTPNPNDTPRSCPPFSQRRQGLAEANRRQDAHRLANATKVKHGVVEAKISKDFFCQSFDQRNRGICRISKNARVSLFRRSRLFLGNSFSPGDQLICGFWILRKIYP
jgi:hypothetical protein